MSEEFKEKKETVKEKIFLGSGVVWDSKAGKRVAEFDKKTHSLITKDPRVIQLCEQGGFKEIKASEIPKEPKKKDPLYEPPIKVDMVKTKEVKK